MKFAEPAAQGGRVYQRTQLATVLTILFLTFLDNTIVSVTLADVQSSLHTGIVGLQWVVNGYMLTFAALMLTGGTLGDLFGRKKVMLWGVALFSVGSLIAMLAQDSRMLICGRIVMGLGAAASEPGTLSMIRHIFPDRQKRAKAVGAWAAVCAVALAMGPIIGGIIIGFWSWRGVFALSLILGVIGFVAGMAFLPENSDPRGRRIDVPGLLLGGLSLVCLSIGVVQGEEAGYFNRWIILLFAVSLISLGAFLVVEKKTLDPVLKLEFFRNPTFSGANFVALSTNFGVFAIFFFTALYLQIMGGFSGFGIAASFLAMAASMITASISSARWVAMRGPRAPCVLGCLLGGVGMFTVRAVLHPGVTTGTLAWAVAIVGLGFGMTLVATNAAVLSIVPAERSGMASSTVNTFRELGGVLGVSVLGAILNANLTSTLSARLAQSGVPTGFISLIIRAVTHGGGRLGPGGKTNAPAGFEDLVNKAVQAAEGAFGTGLKLALLITGFLLFGAAIVAWFSIRQPAQAVSPQERLVA
jgi:EmrB/QacA subfamily drug resistance transporter